jgi:predicted CXXCH cytochrome family protein
MASVTDGYAGSETCKSCHAAEYEEWQLSHHFHAMELPSEKSVRGDFTGVSFVADGDSSYFYQTPSGYAVNYTDITGQTDSLQIAYTFGWTPLQQYLVKTERGRYQTLRASWDTEQGKWFNQYAGDTLLHHTYLHQFSQSMTWNTMCADCHSTNLVKNYFPEADSFHTTYSEATVGCEGCHGPAGAHVALAKSGKADAGALRLVTEQSNVVQVAQCAPCHMRRTVSGEGHMDSAFQQGYLPQNINNRFYHADGQINEEDYVWGSFVQSKMYHEGVKCTDCHNPHTNALKFEGNKLCLQCHESSYDSPGHYFHEPDTESSQCINCHMTGKHYMGNDFRRDHSFRIPRPDLSVDTDIPNACNGCHTDKTAEWAAKALRNRFGAPRENYVDALVDFVYGKKDAQRRLQNLLTQDTVPEIAKETALEYLVNTPSHQVLDLIAFYAKDSHPQMRVQALQALNNAPFSLRQEYGMSALFDTNIFVRYAAALLTADAKSMNAEQRLQWQRVQAQYLEHLNYQADFREGRMALAQYFVRRGKPARAEKEYLMALKFDDALPGGYEGLSILYAQQGDRKKALTVLSRGIAKCPNDARIFYLHGITAFELNLAQDAIHSLSRAVALSNYNPDYSYNLILMLNESGRGQEAEEVLNKALQTNPVNQRLQELKRYLS